MTHHLDIYSDAKLLYALGCQHVEQGTVNAAGEGKGMDD